MLENKAVVRNVSSVDENQQFASLEATIALEPAEESEELFLEPAGVFLQPELFLEEPQVLLEHSSDKIISNKGCSQNSPVSKCNNFINH